MTHEGSGSLAGATLREFAGGQKLFGRYTLVKILGRGGMGIVWLARDEELEREVALKFLPETVVHDRSLLNDLKRETRRSLELTHKNIVRIYDFVQTENSACISMEYIDGDTLSNLRAEKEQKVFQPEEIAAWTSQLCDALDYAHNHARIIHRDLKPANLMVNQKGDLKVSDFGIARSLGDSMSKLTLASAGTSGTLVYMSPQQLDGARGTHLDDIYSLGATLYELLTSKPPFYSGNIDRQILERVAPSLTERRKEFNLEPAFMPPIWEETVAACLAKDPARRPQSTAEVAQRLQSTAPHTVSAPTIGESKPVSKSLAVLPLVNQSGDPGQEYFADGLTEELINRLGRIRPLHVIGRNSSFAFKGRTVDSRVVGQTLGVANLLEGSVRTVGDRVRISVGLVRAADGSQLWTQNYDRELKDIFKVQEEIATAIGEQLRATLLAEVSISPSAETTDNFEASESYRLYFRGRYHWGKRTEDGLHTAIEEFGEAIEINPGNARAWAGLADCYTVLGCWGYKPPHQSYPKAKAAAERALELDDTLSEAHVSLAVARKDYYRDWAGAEKEYRRALELNPSNVTARDWYGECLACLGRHDEAIAEFERARELDPLSLIVAVTLGRHGYCFARQHDRAIKELREIVRTDPDFWMAHLFLGFTYMYQGQFEKALAEFTNAKQLEKNGDMLAGIGYALARSNRHAEARRVLAEAEELRRAQYVQPVVLALIHLGLGEKDEAFLWLEQAYEERAQWLSEMKVDPAFDDLRSDPRFGELLQRMGLA